jgi:lysozyme family protein
VGRVAFSKRTLLRGAALAPLAALGGRASAQDGKLFGLPIPRELLTFIPEKPLDYLRIADGVVRLEKEADGKNIADSPLSRNKGQSLASVSESLYQLALPRLVALIDRAEPVDPGLADKAGELLSELHRSQFELPDILRSAPPEFDMLAADADTVSPLAIGPATAGLPDLDSVLDPPDAQPPVEPPVPLPAPPADAPLPPPLPEPVEEEGPDKPLSRAKDFAALKSEYARLYRKLQVRPERAEAAEWHLAMLTRSRARYEAVAEATGVPWYFIGVIHGLESSFNFRAHLHNGDFPLSTRTRQVPAGRPIKWLPPSDWESSARDALRILGFTSQQDWSLERTLYRVEAFNGFGYRGYGVPTPYLWSFSQVYDRGKFVSDGKFSNSAKSQQCGAAVMLKLLSDAGAFEWPKG